MYCFRCSGGFAIRNFFNSFLKQGFRGEGSICWDEKDEEKNTVKIEIIFTEQEKYLRLIYTLQSLSNEEKIENDYKVNF